MSSDIQITTLDRERIVNLLEESCGGFPYGHNAYKALRAELTRADIVDPRRIPSHIVTMNAQVLLSLDGEDCVVTLVYPRDADPEEMKLSVLSPVGTAILGFGEGRVVRWAVPSGFTEIRIKKILYQPEASGDYHL